MTKLPSIVYARIINSNSYINVLGIRCGALGMGEAYGADTERFVVLRNDLNAFLGSEEGYRQNLLDKFRTDY